MKTTACILQLTQEETARNEVDAKLMRTTDELKEANAKYEIDITARDGEIVQLKDEVSNNYTMCH